MSNQKMKILSLDGGGVRGYLTAMILENVEKQLNLRDGTNKPLGGYFDLIAGTSTGAIIAGLLAIGKSASEVRKIYEDDIKDIFSNEMKRNKFDFFPINKIPVISNRPYFKTKYSDKKLVERAEHHFKNLTFEFGKDIKTHLLITSVDITTMTPRFHKSAYNHKNKPREDELLSNAIIASASAPSYFPVKEKLKYSSNLIDGGIVANNPSLVALIDSFSFTEHENKDDVVLLSVGTGKACEIPYDVEPLQNTTIKWLRQNGSIPLVEILMNSQVALAEFQTSFLMDKLGCKNQYERINPSLGIKIQLDDANKIDLLKNLADLDQAKTTWVLNNL